MCRFTSCSYPAIRSAGHARLLQFPVEKQAGARGQRSIDDPDAGFSQILHGVNMFGVSFLENDALIPLAEIDHHGHAVELTLQKIKIVLVAVLLQQVAGGHMAEASAKSADTTHGA
jgi:hypothetical protein